MSDVNNYYFISELDFISLHLTRYVYINPSYTEVRCVRINIRRDTLDESTEFFYVRLRGPISFSSSSPVNIELETFETTVYISNSGMSTHTHTHTYKTDTKQTHT